ncbi:phosphoesterase [Halomarina oriensis]|uniref:Phosphoesterase n=1 Tax=Halomarina oriensis TaxID=671145 RepID=A0A6B0GQJ7_9EURY|nr:phosphoesterase [Halomarina oriensis]
MLEPVPGEPAAVADCDGERTLVVADYHAGLEVALRYDGVELRSAAGDRRQHLLGLLDSTAVDRVVFLGDLANAIGTPSREERRELTTLLGAVSERVPVTVVKGNHDGDVEAWASESERANAIDVTPTSGTRLGDVGFVHGHTWPASGVASADVVCMGHEHPTIRLEDEVGGARAERVWLRGPLVPDPFVERFSTTTDDGDGTGDPPTVTGELVVCPAFNDRLGGTWTNAGQGFLAPFLPEGMPEAEAYLLDGTRLGPYQRV